MSVRFQSIYNDRRWKYLRARKLAEQDWTCERCGRVVAGRDAEVHHDKPLAKGGDPYPALAELTALCRDCHVAIHRELDGMAADRLAWQEHLREFEESLGRGDVADIAA